LDFPLRSANPSTQSTVHQFHPRVDVVEDENEYKICAELPGLSKQDVQLNVEGEYLTISGNKKSEIVEEDPEKRYRRIERSYGSFCRQFRLPDNVDRNGIDASFENGVLQVCLKKAEKAEDRTKRISIR